MEEETKPKYSEDEAIHDPDRTSSLPSSDRISTAQRDLLIKRFHPVLLCLSENHPGLCFKLDRKESVLGRSQEADYPLDDIRASRRHIRVTYANQGKEEEVPECYVEDLDSRNGTEINGHRLKERTLLEDGDRIIVGKTVLGYFYRDELEINQQERLYESATRDSLTGLLNRTQIDNRLVEEVRLAHRLQHNLCLMLLDVDHFKTVNDTYGHKMGDQVLAHVARIISGFSSGHIVAARWGGEEFAVLMSHFPPDAASNYAEKLRLAIGEAPFRLDSISIPVHVSVGLSMLNEADTAESLFRRADKCLYEAKESGRNRVVARHANGG